MRTVSIECQNSIGMWNLPSTAVGRIVYSWIKLLVFVGLFTDLNQVFRFGITGGGVPNMSSHSGNTRNVPR